MTDYEARRMFLACLAESGGPAPREIRVGVERFLNERPRDPAALERALRLGRVVTLTDASGRPVGPAVPSGESLLRLSPRDLYLLRAAGFVDRDDFGYRLNHAAEVFYRRG